jgi:hypothetical protein
MPSAAKAFALVSALVITALAAPAVLAATPRGVSELVPGRRVRLTAADTRVGPRAGRLISVSPDSLVIAADSTGGISAIARSEITGIEISRGRTHRVGRDTGIGFLIGAGSGALLGAISTDPNDFIFNKPADGAVLGAIFLGPIGALVGLIVGVSHLDAERWRPLDQVGVDIVLPDSRSETLRVALAVRF